MVKEKKRFLAPWLAEFPVGTDWSPSRRMLLDTANRTYHLHHNNTEYASSSIFLPRVHVPIILYQWGFSPGYLSRTGLVSAKNNQLVRTDNLMLEP